MLSRTEIADYESRGYVIPGGFRLSADRITALQNGLEDVLANNPDIPSDRLINVHLSGHPPYGVAGFEGFAGLATDTQILDMVEQLVGPDIILWSTHLFCKAGTKGREVPWHQDGQYWPIRPLATCSVWVALDNVDRGNGALRVLPGSHRKGDYDHHVDENPDLGLNQVVDPSQYDASDAVYLELEAGQISLHDIHLVHGSAANDSGRRRAGLAMRYMPATSCLHRDREIRNAKFDWSQMPISLVRGANRHDGNDFSAGHVCGDNVSLIETRQ